MGNTSNTAYHKSYMHKNVSRFYTCTKYLVKCYHASKQVHVSWWTSA